MSPASCLASAGAAARRSTAFAANWIGNYGKRKSTGKRKTGLKRKTGKKKSYGAKKAKTASQIFLSGQRLVDMEVRRNQQLAVTDIKRLFSGQYDGTTGEFTGSADSFMADQNFETFQWATANDVAQRLTIRDKARLF